MRFKLNSSLLIFVAFMCSIYSSCWAVVDNTEWEHQSLASQVNSVMPSVAALLDFYQDNAVDCDTTGAQMISLEQHPYFFR